MRRFVFTLALLGSVGLVALAAQRIETRPAEPHLKYLFPGAVAFSPFSGTPLHYKAYAADPRTNPNAAPIGLVFWTTDVVPNEQGYHGPIHMLIGMDMAGIITGIYVTHNTEPYGYFSVEPPEFAAQFEGKRVRDAFRVGADVDAVSRATITISSATRAIRDSTRAMARQFLNPASVK